MCKCTPEIRTPFCGKGNCIWPGSKKEGERGKMQNLPSPKTIETISDTIKDLVSDFLYYDRKEDEDLPLGEIEKLIEHGFIDKESIIEIFKRELDANL